MIIKKTKIKQKNDNNDNIKKNNKPDLETKNNNTNDTIFNILDLKRNTIEGTIRIIINI